MQRDREKYSALVFDTTGKETFVEFPEGLVLSQSLPSNCRRGTHRTMMPGLPISAHAAKQAAGSATLAERAEDRGNSF